MRKIPVSWLYVDEREKNSGIIEYLKKMGILPIIKRLDMGDFIVSDKIVIERKSVNDLVNSYMDGRLLEQLRRLKENYEIVLVLVEGSPSILRKRDMPEAMYWQILAKILKSGVSVITVSSPRQCAMMIHSLIVAERNEGRFPLLRRGKKSLTTNETRKLILESFPGIGEKTAEKLLKYFGTVRNVLMATKEELATVIGAKRAAEIIKILDTEEKNIQKKQATLDILSNKGS